MEMLLLCTKQWRLHFTLSSLGGVSALSQGLVRTCREPVCFGQLAKLNGDVLWRVNVVHFLIKNSDSMLQPYTAYQFSTGNKVQLLHYADKGSTKYWMIQWMNLLNKSCLWTNSSGLFFFFQMNCFWHSYRRDQEGFKTQSKFIEVRTFVFGFLGLPGE